MHDLKATGSLVLEKIEELAVSDDGDALLVNDNDGVDDRQWRNTVDAF